MNVKVAELRAITERLLSYLEDSGRDEVDVNDDYYWEVSVEELYDPTRDPGTLSLGQLSHDWERLKAISSDEDPPIGYALVWLASVLRNVGHRSVY